MEPSHRELLRTQRLFLSDQLLVSDSVVPFLYQEEVLTLAQVEDIESEPTERRKVHKLLDVLPNRGPRAFHCFLRALDDFSWVREALQLQLQQLQQQQLQQQQQQQQQQQPPRPQPQPQPGAALSDNWQLPAELQRRLPSDRELSRLAAALGADWEAVLLDLGVSAAALYRCRCDHSLSTHGAALAALLLWRQRQGRRASAQRLALSLRAAGLHPALLLDVLL